MGSENEVIDLGKEILQKLFLFQYYCLIVFQYFKKIDIITETYFDLPNPLFMKGAFAHHFILNSSFLKSQLIFIVINFLLLISYINKH